MRVTHLTTTAAVLAAFIIGCSKQPSQSSSHLPANTKDLGKVELTQGTPRPFSLGEGKGCIITGTQLSDDINVKVVVLTTNAGGTVQRSEGQMSTLPGRQCIIGIGDTKIGLTPTLKSP